MFRSLTLSRLLGPVLALATLSAAACTAPIWSAGAAGPGPRLAPALVVERKLPAGRDYVGSPAFDGEGNLWFGIGRYVRTPVPPKFVSELGGFSLDGRFEEPASPGTRFAAMTRGGEGAAWFAGHLAVGRIGPGGQTSEFPTYGEPQGLAAGPDGNIWFTEGGGSYAAIGKVTPDGGVTEYGLPASSDPIGITAGPEGDLWFTEYSRHALGRITPTGQVTEFPLPDMRSHPQSITEGPDGNLWFTDQGTGSVGRMTPAGRVTEFVVPTGPEYPGQIISAPDGRLWFTSGRLGQIGRITTTGLQTVVSFPDSDSRPIGIAVGPEGEIVYTADGEGPCNGGGGSCQLVVPKKPAIVGTITEGPLQERVAEGRAEVSGRSAALTLACGGGDARDRCDGILRLSVPGADGSATSSGIAGGKVRFRLRADESRTVRPRLSAAALRLVKDKGRVVARASLSGFGLKATSMAVVLQRPGF